MKLLGRINAAPLALLVIATSMGCAEPAGEAVGSTHAESTKTAPTTLPKAARDATATLKQALAKDSVFAGRLGVEIATLRTVLSDDEVIAYQQKYAELDRVTKSERDVAEAAAALRSELDKIMADPTEVMRGAHIHLLAGKGRSGIETVVSYGPKQLYESFKLLASTSEGDAAAAFADRLLDHDPKLKAVWSKHDDARILDELGTPGLLKALIRTLASLDATSTKSPIDEVRNQVRGTSKALSGVLNTLTLLGDKEVRELADDLGKKTAPLGIALAVWQLGRDANNAHWKGVLEDLLSLPGAAVATLEFAEALNVVSASSRIFVAGKTVSKLAGGLGVLMQTVALVSSLDEWDKSPGTKVAIVGNAVSALASVLALCGVASAGPIGAVVALATGLIGPLLDQAREDGRQNKDKEAVLVAMGWNAKHARNVARAQGRFLGALTGTFGLDRTQALEIIDLIPEVAHGDSTELGVMGNNGTLTLNGLITLQQIFHGSSARGLLQAAMGDESNAKRRGTRLEAALVATDWGSYGRPVFTADMTPAAYRSQFMEAVKHAKDVAGADGRPAVDAVAAYVAALR